MLPHTIILEPLQDCFLSGVLGCCALLILFSSTPLLVIYYFIFHLNGPLPFSFAQFLFVWLYREGSAFPTWCRAVLNPNIKWRSGNFRLRWGGRIVQPTLLPRKANCS
ncbi:unnamed protein product [Gongylonema pulchrum]|uniref:Uncharacterized protein n=1 Tax=Gongylonema pulchrum TaxID=637853 RepID=A0A183CY79_9BILA|nr:unnamed protein product [Gongylonema pulchrum]